MDPLAFLFAAYSVVWVTLFFYLLTIDRRSRRAEAEIEDLKRRSQ